MRIALTCLSLARQEDLAFLSATIAPIMADADVLVPCRRLGKGGEMERDEGQRIPCLVGEIE